MVSKVKYIAKKQRTIGQSSSQGSIAVCFQNKAAKKRFDEKFATRMVKKTRVIDYKFFCKCNFSFISTFDEFGWTKFLSLNYLMHETLEHSIVMQYVLRLMMMEMSCLSIILQHL